MLVAYTVIKTNASPHFYAQTVNKHYCLEHSLVLWYCCVSLGLMFEAVRLHII